MCILSSETPKVVRERDSASVVGMRIAVQSESEQIGPSTDACVQSSQSVKPSGRLSATSERRRQSAAPHTET